MKRIIFVLSMLIGVAHGQTTGFFRYDTIAFQKVGGNSEFNLYNGTRNVTGGVLTNIGGGRTRFMLPTGSTNTSIGSGYKIAVNGTNNVKSLTATNLLTADSATNGQVGIKFGGTATQNTTAALGTNNFEWTTGGAMGSNVAPYKITGTPTSYSGTSYRMASFSLGGTTSGSGKSMSTVYIENLQERTSGQNVALRIKSNRLSNEQNYGIVVDSGRVQIGLHSTPAIFDPGILSIIVNNIPGKPTLGQSVLLDNTTFVTAAAPNQSSPQITWYGFVWDSLTSSSKETRIDNYSSAHSNSTGTPIVKFNWEYYSNQVFQRNMFAIGESGQLYVNNLDPGTNGQIMVSQGPNLSAKWINQASIVGSTPPLQDVLTAGSTGITSHTVSGTGSSNLVFNNFDEIDFEGLGNNHFTGGAWNFDVDLNVNDSLFLPNLGALHSANDSMMVWNPTRKTVGYRPIPSGGSSSLTSTYVGYGDGSNALTGEAAFNYNATTNVLSAGSLSTSASSNQVILNNGTENAELDLDASYVLNLGHNYAASDNVTQYNFKYYSGAGHETRGIKLSDVGNGYTTVLSQLSSGALYWTDGAGAAGSLSVSSWVNPSDGNTVTNGAGYTKVNGQNFGIGTTPSAQLHTTGTVRFANFGAGTATFDGSGNVSSSSDKRLKENIRPFKSGLAVIRKLNPNYFTWNKMSGLNMTDKNIGFIAQDILPLIPEAVGKDSKGYLSLNDRPILAANVNATKELYDMILALQKEVAELKAIIKAKK